MKIIVFIIRMNINLAPRGSISSNFKRRAKSYRRIAYGEKKRHSISPKIRQYQNPHLQAEFCEPFAKSVRRSTNAVCN